MQKMNPEILWNTNKKRFNKNVYNIIIPKKETIYVAKRNTDISEMLTDEECEIYSYLLRNIYILDKYIPNKCPYGELLGGIILDFDFCVLANNSVIPPEWALKEIRRWLKKQGWKHTCPVASEPELESLLLSFRKTYPEMRVYHSDTGEEWDLDYGKMIREGCVF